MRDVTLSYRNDDGETVQFEGLVSDTTIPKLIQLIEEDDDA